MPYVHHVSSDEDELDEGDWHYEEPRERSPIPWVPIGSAAAAVVLLGILVFLLFGGGGGKKPSASTTTTGAPVSTLPALAETDPRVVAAQAALDAWGKFEGTGNLADLGSTMDPAGKQYLALKKQAESGKKRGAYTVVLTNPRLVGQTADQVAIGEQTVRADLVWKRQGAPDEAVTWDLVLRPRVNPPGLWLFTARTASNGSSGDFCGAAKQAEAALTQTDLTARLNAAATDADRLVIAKEAINQRAAADNKLAETAPEEIKAKAQAVATGWASYQSLANTAKSYGDFDAINKKAGKDKAFTEGEKARPDVNAYVSQVCGVNIDPNR